MQFPDFRMRREKSKGAWSKRCGVPAQSGIEGRQPSRLIHWNLYVSQWKDNTRTVPELPVQVQSAKLLGSKAVKINQSADALELALPDEVNWDPADTVMALKVDAKAAKAGL